MHGGRCDAVSSRPRFGASHHADLRKSGGSPHPFVTNRVEDPALVPDLRAAKVPFAGKADYPWMSVLLSWVLPVFLFFWLFRAMGHMGVPL